MNEALENLKTDRLFQIFLQFFDMKNSATNLSFWLHSSGNVLGIDASTNNAATFPSNWSDINSIYVRRSNTSEVSGAVR